MRVHDVLDRLVRNRLLDAVEHGHRPVVVLRRLDENDVVLELHGHRVVAAAGQVIDPVGDLLRGDSHRRCRRRLTGRLLHVLRHVDGRRCVRLHVRDRQIQNRIATLLLHDVRRKLHAAEILVVEEVGFGHRIAEHGGISARFDLRHQVVRAERRSHRRACRGEADRPAGHRGVVRLRALDHALRRQRPDGEQPIAKRRLRGRCCRRAAGRSSIHVPRGFPADDLDLFLRRQQRQSAAAAHR